ncbi:PadR family transcriptional regulator [Actinokineospora auranticolor]|uniref:PadR family transcriptional regulator n=1 Tax=Actinokineospora auranticolor TaxID=155976 RepID=A0A2S6H1M8_9PSEU|nr:PadR family transcriptional regulator [Actinokineospora auranticolor]PPK71317.1 PadR family transcriptional regulator [Actinokineospora auranticolor]
MARRPSAQTLAVLELLARDPDTPRHGYELGKELGLKAGTLYPILIRLCERGHLAASWESDPPAGRPPRHLYRLLGTGLRLLDQAREAAPATTSPALGGAL